MRTPTGLLATIVLTTLLAGFGCETQSTRSDAPVPDYWRAWLSTPGGDLPFILEMKQDGPLWRSAIVGPEERIEVPVTRWDGDQLVLEFPHYDSKIRAYITSDGQRFAGAWWKTRSNGRQAIVPFAAEYGVTRPFAPQPGDGSTGDISGRWLVHFDSDELPAVAEFEVDAERGATGTFMTTTGDYRFLSGSFENDRLRLSTFDGAHAFLFDATAQNGELLQGDFWSGNWWHETWTAARDEHARLPDSFKLTRWTGAANLDSLVFRDLDGEPRSVGEMIPPGKPALIEVFGSWCPNCSDMAEYMVELRETYGDQITMLGLAFELTGDFKRDARQVRLHGERHGTSWPVLLAGISDKRRASDELPVLDRVRAYPTTIFIDSAGNVRAVHTGFSGPATGEAHDALRATFESTIDAMLDGGAG